VDKTLSSPPLPVIEEEEVSNSDNEFLCELVNEPQSDKDAEIFAAGKRCFCYCHCVR